MYQLPMHEYKFVKLAYLQDIQINCPSAYQSTESGNFSIHIFMCVPYIVHGCTVMHLTSQVFKY